MVNVTSSIGEEDQERKETSHRIAVEISEENAAHMAENKILKEQNKIDEQVRNEYEKKVMDNDLTKEKSLESEKWNKQKEYRQFLLKQIEDKEKHKKVHHSPEIRGNSYTYSEELMTPELRKNLKLTKQQEMKDALDECIRMKNALKLQNKEKELAEERIRDDFMKKREADELMIREKAKLQTEIKEQRKEEAAKHWNTNKDDEREQFIDALIRKDPTLSQLSNEIAEDGQKTQLSPADVEDEAEVLILPEEDVNVEDELNAQFSTKDEDKIYEDEIDEEYKENEIHEVGQVD